MKKFSNLLIKFKANSEPFLLKIVYHSLWCFQKDFVHNKISIRDGDFIPISTENSF